MKFVGRQSRQYTPGCNQYSLDLADPRQALERDDAIAVAGAFALQRLDGAAELVDRQLEPQLVRLMDDDKQQLVIGVGHRSLRRQQFVDFQIRGVGVCAHRLLRIGVAAMSISYAPESAPSRVRSARASGHAIALGVRTAWGRLHHLALRRNEWRGPARPGHPGGEANRRPLRTS